MGSGSRGLRGAGLKGMIMETSLHEVRMRPGRSNRPGLNRTSCKEVPMIIPFNPAPRKPRDPEPIAPIRRAA